MRRAGESIGKYRLVRELGAGGMGVVFEAINVSTDARVAIKFLGADAARNEFVAGRFMREAKAAGRLRSRYAARVFDADRSESGEPYIVMELLEGRDLASELRRGGIDVARACTFIVQACAGVDEAHRLGIVHRDLKPANLFLAVEGNEIVKVLDFGVSKISDSRDGDATGSLQVLGTLRYMSPEHISDARSVDARTDVWALGVILYYALVGELPFDGEGASLIGHVLSPTVVPRITRPDVPPQVVDIVAQCLVKHRDRRLSTVAELAELLAPFAPASAVSDALGEIRTRRNASTPRDGIASVGAMDPTVTALPHETEELASTEDRPYGRPAAAPAVSPMPVAGPARAVDPTFGATSNTQAGLRTAVRMNVTLMLLVVGLALTSIALAVFVLVRERARPASVSSSVAPPATSAPAIAAPIVPSTPPSEHTAPPAIVTTPPPAASSARVRAGSKPHHNERDASSPSIPALL